MQNIISLKKCSKCGIDKELSSQNFTRHSGHKDGFDTQCKMCKKIYDQERYKNKRSKILAQKKEYYQKNKIELAAKQRAHHQKRKKENEHAKRNSEVV